MRLRLGRPALVLAAVFAAAAVGIVGPSASAVQTQGARPGRTSTVGALFNITAAGQLENHFCTASVVDSPDGDLIVTAAHCLQGRTPQSMAFVPGYSRGLEPFGVWTVTRVIEDQAWTESADPNDDFAFLVVHQAGAKGRIEELTGGEVVGINVPPGQKIKVVGYPNAQNGLLSCENTALGFSPTQYQFDCGGFTNGTSGSPFLAVSDTPGGGETVIGVIGGYQLGGDTPSVSYAAKFSSNFSELYAKAVAEAGQLTLQLADLRLPSRIGAVR